MYVDKKKTVLAVVGFFLNISRLCLVKEGKLLGVYYIYD